MKDNIIHGIKRIAILVLSWFLAVPIGFIYLDIVASDRRCGTGDVLIVFFLIVCFSFLWIIGLGIEAIILNKKCKKTKRNINLIMAGIILLIFIQLIIKYSYY
ncbi:hypothetical protein KRX57_05695 [Weeksellaceae bacterium TAE3-ERU29]|nr:hypothetical protein [Weeksellaceae bacterium TAE3-ERU29]